ncbi:UPF0147 family protein [Candidatus Woesearchaeota archaeon]|nr:UPF0147 family protein [Candidatus Woesearchaeota archaeon]
MTKGDDKVEEIIEILNELEEDITVPRNVKDKIKIVMNVLKEEVDLKIRINKVLHELDEIADDPNLQPYTRTQIWNVVSMLEKVS